MIQFTWSSVLSILIGLLGLDIVVIVHELGHYFFCRIFHVDVEKIQLGLGPSLFSKCNSKGTKYSLGVVPFGAFCKMDTISLGNAKPLSKIIIYAAGPLANVIFSVIVYSIYLCILKTPFMTALVMSLSQCFNETITFLDALIQLISGKTGFGDTFSGTFIAALNIGSLAELGFAGGILKGVETCLWLCASVSLSLAVANMMPIPALDGGFILIILIEKITGRTFSDRFYFISQCIGLVLLLVVLPILRMFF